MTEGVGEPRGMGRRRFVELGALLAAALPLGCGGEAVAPPADVGDGRLDTTWKPPTTAVEPGEHPLGLRSGRDGFIRVPAGLVPETPAPLALLLHGAGQNAHEWDGGFPLFDELGVVALAVDSLAASWDLRYGAFGPDVAFIDEALAETFDACNVDPARIAICGFSDGASYALSLGLTNGDLFTHLVGFSPGFVVTAERHGKPPVLLTHGSRDAILPVGFTRELAAQLLAEGHEVLYEEFDGRHELPPEIAERAFDWFVNGPEP